MISVLIPTKGRPESLRRCVKSIPFDVGIVIVATCKADVPNDVINADRVMKRIMFEPGISIIQAQNLAAQASIGHILPASDDVEFMNGCFGFAMEKLDKNVVGLNVINMEHSKYGFMLISREYYDEYGLFDPDYKHFFADTQFGEEAEARGRFIVCKEAQMKHYHPGNGPGDDTHKNGRAEKLSHDTEVYNRRVLHAKV